MLGKEGETGTRFFELIGELRAEHAALSLIHFLRDQGQLQSEWLAALSADQRARQFAHDWK